MNIGVFMLEAIALDAGFDRLHGAQLDSVIVVIDAVQRRFPGCRSRPCCFIARCRRPRKRVPGPASTKAT